MLAKVMIPGLAVALTAAPSWTAILRPTNDKRPEGSARVEAKMSTTRVTIELSGAKPGSEMPWYIHEGTCRDPGEIWGTPASYPPLRFGATGKVHGAAILPGTLPAYGEYSVIVHKSLQDMEPVACGAMLQVPMPEPLPSESQSAPDRSERGPNRAGADDRGLALSAN